MGIPGGMEMLIVLVIVVLLFGAKKIPELAKGLGIGIKEFKKASKDEVSSENDKIAKENSDKVVEETK